MAEFRKTVRKKKLGTPPARSETKANLDKPETAPPTTEEAKPKRPVGRPKTSRTAQLTTTLTPEFKKRLRMLSVTHDKDMGEIIEEAVAMWEKSKN